MTADRFEWEGAGLALVLHAALIAALSLSLADLNQPPEPPAMEVDFVEDVALEAAAPQPVPTPSAPPPAPLDRVVPEPVTTPLPPPPPPTPRAVTQPAPRPQPAPPRRAQPAPPKPQKKPAPRPTPRPGLGDDFLAKLDDDLAPRPGPAKPAAPTFNAKARTNIATSIANQAQRCADRQPYLGEGADQVSMQVKLSFARSGRLARPPIITAMAGPSEARGKYGELLEDQVRRIFADCAPFRLPADLYDTDDGGWKETTLRYRVRK